MKSLKAFVLILGLIFLLGGVSKNNTAIGDEIDKTFSKKSKIKMDFVNGNCEILKSTDDLIHIKLIYDISPLENFKSQINEKDNSLELSEQFIGSAKGDVKWILSIPSGIKINFTTVSGNFSIDNLNTKLSAKVISGNIKITNSDGSFNISTASGNIISKSSSGDFKLSTASGNLNVNNSEGKYKLSTVSGDIIVDNIKGQIKLNSASGNVNATNITINDKCSFNTASGNINVKLSSSPQNDISLNSATGNAILDFNGNSISGFFVFSTKQNSGEIKAPFQFESEREITKSDDNIYLIKSSKIGSEFPVIRISTLLGLVELRK